MTDTFKALVLRQGDNRQTLAGIENLTDADLPDGDVLLATSSPCRVRSRRVAASRRSLARRGSSPLSTGWKIRTYLSKTLIGMASLVFQYSSNQTETSSTTGPNRPACATA